MNIEFLAAADREAYRLIDLFPADEDPFVDVWHQEVAEHFWDEHRVVVVQLYELSAVYDGELGRAYAAYIQDWLLWKYELDTGQCGCEAPPYLRESRRALTILWQSYCREIASAAQERFVPQLPILPLPV